MHYGGKHVIVLYKIKISLEISGDKWWKLREFEDFYKECI